MRRWYVDKPEYRLTIRGKPPRYRRTEQAALEYARKLAEAHGARVDIHRGRRHGKWRKLTEVESGC